MTYREPRPGEWEIYTSRNGEPCRTLLTNSRSKAVAEVARLLAKGASDHNIYATYDQGKNFQQARAHLLLPEQQAEFRRVYKQLRP